MHSFACALLRSFILALFVINPLIQAASVDVPWSDKKYGPDGPWQAVKIKVGGWDSERIVDVQNPAIIDVYPGGVFSSFTFSKLACGPFKDDLNCGEGGTWEPDSDATSSYNPKGWHPTMQDKTYGLLTGGLNFTQRALTINDKTVYNATISHVNTGNITYPNGKVGGMMLGFLALGGDDTQQFFVFGDKNDERITANVYNGWLWKNKQISSYTHSLHIGSAILRYPGSLVFGGYNKGRVIGPLTYSFADDSKIDLLDIGIGVEDGNSPFNFSKMDNLLISNKSLSGIPHQVKIDPTTPYLSLPGATCQRLAELLPIKFDPESNFYLWRTEDPMYKKIVTSPAYLSFVFPPSRGSDKNVTIKAPFALFNLTLEQPIVDKPTQYFPCNSFKISPEGDSFRLGRAFMQAAFVGRNWDTKSMWMGQAPGPGRDRKGLGDEVKDIPSDATSLETWDTTDKNLFNQSWAPYWTVIGSPRAVNSATGGAGIGTATGAAGEVGSSGLSVGAKAGIGIGTAAVALIAIGVGIIFWRTSKSSSGKGGKGMLAPSYNLHKHPSPTNYDGYAYAPQELQEPRTPTELYAEHMAHELPANISSR